MDASQKIRDELSEADAGTYESTKWRYDASSTKVREAKKVCVIQSFCNARRGSTVHLT